MRKNELISGQKTGHNVGAENAVETANYREAVNLFYTARKRLFDINQWHQFSGNKVAAFQHMNEEGELLERKPRKGDLIRIDLLGPGPRLGNGYDWVKIEAVEDVEDRYHDEDYCAIRVRPVNMPEGKANASAYYFTTAVSYTIYIQREARVVKANEIIKHESTMHTTGNSKGFFEHDPVISKIKWNALLKALLQSG